MANAGSETALIHATLSTCVGWKAHNSAAIHAVYALPDHVRASAQAAAVAAKCSASDRQWNTNGSAPPMLHEVINSNDDNGLQYAVERAVSASAKSHMPELNTCGRWVQLVSSGFCSTTTLSS